MTALTVRPEWADWDHISYEDIIGSWGYQVISLQKTENDYVALLRDGDEWGVLVLGYGSDLTNDPLEVALSGIKTDDWSSFNNFCWEMRDEIGWFDAVGDAEAWLWDSVSHENDDWWAFEPEVIKVFDTFLYLLASYR